MLTYPTCLLASLIPFSPFQSRNIHNLYYLVFVSLEASQSRYFALFPHVCFPKDVYGIFYVPTLFSL